MATNRDLLKEAIADAKSVKEVAIANAKLALEEAFTPFLKDQLSAKLQEMDKDEDDVKEEVEEVEEEMAKFRKNQNSDNINTSDSNIETKTKENNGDMLIGLGGAILRSNTIGELGGNIADMSTARQARQDSQKLAGIQGRYYEAQTDKLIAGIAGMPLKELQATAKIINDGIESGSLTLEEYGPTLQSIANKVALLQGIETPLSAQEKMLAKTRA